MGNRLVLDLQKRTINPDLGKLYYAKVPFYLGSYLVGLLWEEGVPPSEWPQRLTEELQAFNRDQLGGAVFPYVIAATVDTCVKNQLDGNGRLFNMIRREGLTSLTYTLTGYPNRKGKPRKGPKGPMAA